MELEELSRIQGKNAKNILNRKITSLTDEYSVMLDALRGMKTIRISNRLVTLPGLERHTPLILQVLAEFKEKKQRNVQPLMYAKADDIVIEPIRPEQFTVNAVTLDNWIQAALAVGERALLPAVAQVGAATTVAVDDDEVFIFTDFVEMKPAIRITAIQGEIDGSLYQPLEMRLQMNASDLQMFELDFPWICDVMFDIDAKCEYAGDSELTPFGVHICLGSQIAAIT